MYRTQFGENFYWPFRRIRAGRPPRRAVVHEPELNDTGCATRYRTKPFQRVRPGGLAESLRHVLRDIEGHLVSGYADGGGAPDKQFTPGQIQLAAQRLVAQGWAGAGRVA